MKFFWWIGFWPALVLGQDSLHKEVGSLREFFLRGSLHGRVRQMNMVTFHDAPLQDHAAGAIGMAISYETAPFHGFQLGLSGLFTFRAFGYQMDVPDSAGLGFPRFELQLFDVKNPENYSDLDRLDELYLKYHRKNIWAEVGRISVQTSLVNPMDTRMKPYTFQGVQAGWHFRRHHVMGAFLHRVAPRSTVHWYDMGQSIGVFSAGHQFDGTPSAYAGKTETPGVGIFHYRYGKEGEALAIDAWNYIIFNVSNTLHSRISYTLSKGWMAGVEYLQQGQVGNGGHDQLEFQYFPDQTARIFGGRLGYHGEKWQVYLNGAWATREGRFTFPTEWGREQFWTTVARSRTEGLGGFRLLNLSVRLHPLKNLFIRTDVAHLEAPKPEEFRLNKYGNVSYTQWNMDIDYVFHKAFEGLHIRFISALKWADDPDLTPERLYYTANYQHLTLCAQLDF
jgi:hypothetical protein